MSKKDAVRIFFTADPHFGHGNVISYCNRPYPNSDAMNEDIIKIWNKRVRPQDTVFILGDVIWTTFARGSSYRDFMAKLNGNKILVVGNHDKITTYQALNWGYSAVCHSMTLRICGETVLLSHYPYRLNLLARIKMFFKNGNIDVKHSDKRPKDEGGWLIHGHTHSKERLSPYNKKMIHVGFDVNYNLVPMHEIETIINQYKKENEK